MYGETQAAERKPGENGDSIGRQHATSRYSGYGSAVSANAVAAIATAAVAAATAALVVTTTTGSDTLPAFDEVEHQIAGAEQATAM